MLEALAAVSNSVRQQLQQAFISQYSTDDNPVSCAHCLLCCKQYCVPIVGHGGLL
jgi:hypothetical protein